MRVSGNGKDFLLINHHYSSYNHLHKYNAHFYIEIIISLIICLQSKSPDSSVGLINIKNVSQECIFFE